MSTTTATPRATAHTSTGSDTGEARTNAKAATYKPSIDSSPQWKKEADKDGRLHLDLTDGACLCGCNQKAAARFRPGHDAALKGKLARAALNKANVTLHFGDQTAQTETRAFAAKLSTEKHDWAAALDRAVERAAKAAEEAKKRREEAAAKRAEAAKQRGEAPKLSLADFA